MQDKTEDRYGRSSGKLKYPKNPTWCPGCGNYGIWGSLKIALKKINVPKENIVIVYDVGCSGNMTDFNEYYALHSLHGRTLPTAVGVKLANHNLKVLAIIGDGGCYGEGGTHFINLMRGNHDVTLLVHDNHRYSLTTGQMSPTTDKGIKTKSTPFGTIERPLNPIAIAVSNHAPFIAREFAGDIPRLSERLKEAINHTGFSMLDVLQPCPVFNKQQSYDWYRENMVKLDTESHDTSNRQAAWEQAMRTDKLPIGLFFKEEIPAYHQEVSSLETSPLLQHNIETVDMNPFLEDFR